VQTIALDIAAIKDNWNSGVAYIGEVNRGHSDNIPPKSLPAHSDEVNQNCFATQESCTLSNWNSHVVRTSFQTMILFGIFQAMFGNGFLMTMKLKGARMALFQLTR